MAASPTRLADRPAPSSTHHFDRSVFAMELDSLELTETIRSLERLIDGPRITNQTRVSLRFAIDALKRELDRD